MSSVDQNIDPDFHDLDDIRHITSKEISEMSPTQRKNYFSVVFKGILSIFANTTLKEGIWAIIDAVLVQKTLLAFVLPAFGIHISVHFVALAALIYGLRFFIGSWGGASTILTKLQQEDSGEWKDTTQKAAKKISSTVNSIDIISRLSFIVLMGFFYIILHLV